MSKITVTQLKKWGKAYQKGRPVPLKAQLAQLEYIIENLDTFLKAWEKCKDKDMSFKNYIGIELGMWEVKYGFYRKFNLKSIIKKELNG